MQKQVRQKDITLRQVMTPALFSQGFADAWQDLAPRYDIDAPPGRESICNRLWSYERGRAFATWSRANGLDPRPLKKGNRVRAEALRALYAAVESRAVI